MSTVYPGCIASNPEATRATRMASAVEWLAEGKRRNWKYERRA